MNSKTKTLFGIKKFNLHPNFLNFIVFHKKLINQNPGHKDQGLGDVNNFSLSF